mmetsp:Transcript_74363/g.198688  ORF Transcript_74363/g.198688 Transcript_74363/m.198688 type:complete len:203 (+) Transcript_74363:237-845(+)
MAPPSRESSMFRKQMTSIQDVLTSAPPIHLLTWLSIPAINVLMPVNLQMLQPAPAACTACSPRGPLQTSQVTPPGNLQTPLHKMSLQTPHQNPPPQRTQATDPGATAKASGLPPTRTLPAPRPPLSSSPPPRQWPPPPPPPPSDSTIWWALVTMMLRPPISLPFMASRAADAAAASWKVTNPNPRDRPLNLLVRMIASHCPY